MQTLGFRTTFLLFPSLSAWREYSSFGGLSAESPIVGEGSPLRSQPGELDQASGFVCGIANYLEFRLSRKPLHCITSSEQGIRHGTGDEAAVIGDAPSSLVYEEVVQFGGAVEPKDIAGVLVGDAGSEMPTIREISGVVGHSFESVAIEFRPKGV